MKNLHCDINFENYRALPAANWSGLKLYAKSPAHYRHHVDNPMPTTPACLVGQAVHALVLEGEAVYQKQFAVAPEGIDRRTKAGKDLWATFEAAAADRGILTAEQDRVVRGMAAAVTSNPKAARLLERCTLREVSTTWTDDDSGLDCKARLDALAEKDGLVFDLKTCQDAGLDGFQRTAWKYGYHGQAAFYLDGLRAAGITAQFLFVCVEAAPPHGVAIFLADDDFVEAGRVLVRRCLDLHSECLAANTWPGYPDAIQTLTLPAWARTAA